MAEALIGGSFLSASLQLLFDRLASPQVVDFFKGRKVDDQSLMKLTTIMESVKRVVDDAEEQQISKPAVTKWLDDLKDAIYEADDFLDEIGYEALRSKIETGYPVRSFFSLLNPFKKGMKPRLIEILERLEYLVKQKVTLGLRERAGQRNPVSGRIPTTCLIDESGVFGREDDKKEVIQLLLSDVGNDNNLGVIPIMGIGGVGKTTLAQLVYNDKSMEDWFDVKAWVYVSEEFEVCRVTKDILEEVSGKTCCGKTLNQLQLELKNTLNGKKFLLVLDDVWNDSYADWDILQRPLKFGARGSKMVVTTRNESVASIMRTFPNYQLKELGDDECWLLFAKHAFNDENVDAYSYLEEIGRRVARKCKGIPLAAKLLGGLLRSKRDAAEWKKVLRSNMWDLSNDNILPALKLSYHYLPAHLKPCFTYSAIFSKGFEFEKEDLILLWMAEGFLVQPDGDTGAIEMGEGYFNDLVSRSFFQRSSLHQSCFVMHDLMNDLAKFVSGNFCLRLEGDTDNSCRIPKRTRHFSYARTEHGASRECDSIIRQAELLHTFLLMEWSCIGNEVISDLLPKLRRVRVLSLSQQGSIGEIPLSFGNLKHLRYLNLSATSIKRLPEIVSTLYNLQVLILCQCKDLVELPSQSRRLINLCHLDIRETNLQGMPSEIGRLTKLEKLTDFMVRKQTGSSIRELGKLQHLRGQLCVWNLENVTDVQDATYANLRGKKHLSNLALGWNNDNGMTIHEKHILERLRPHTDLECLSIVGYGYARFPDWVCDISFCNIVSLKLSECKYCCSLPPIGQLASLKDLMIKGFHGVTTIGPEFYSSCKFAYLETLRFEDMPQWREWVSDVRDDEGEAFPLLKQLYIKECPSLTNALPKYLPSLRTLEIEGCQQLVASLPRMESILRMKLKDQSRLLRLVKLANGLYRFVAEGLQCLDSLLQEMEQTDGVFNALQEIEITNCESLKCFPLDIFGKLQILRINKCPNLESLFTHEATHADFRSLTCLEIRECPNLVSFSKGESPIPNLTRLLLLGCSTIETFPGKMLLSSTITSIKILDFQNLKSLDYKGLGHLTSLKELEICKCPMLQSIPEEGLPSSLSSLSISLCPVLQQRCQPGTGEDWSKISHISELEINFVKIN